MTRFVTGIVDEDDIWLFRGRKDGDLFVNLEPSQAKLLDRICSGPTISADELRNAGALEVPAKSKKAKKVPVGPDLFDRADS